jgi:hypothetical protein
MRRYAAIHDQIVEVCQTAETLTEVECRLGLTSPSTSLRRYIRTQNIPLPAYIGQRACGRLSQRTRERVTIAALTTNSPISRGAIRKFLFRSGLKEAKCEVCGWCEKRSDGRIPVHLHHKNGDDSDNRLENLQILCPNHHALTENYAGKNRFNRGRHERHERLRAAYLSPPRTPCAVCGRLGYGVKYCSQECAHLATRKVGWPDKETLRTDLLSMSWTAVGRKYGVSDNAVRKWAKFYGLR